jgi:hypothetical protein
MIICKSVTVGNNCTAAIKISFTYNFPFQNGGSSKYLMLNNYLTH